MKSFQYLFCTILLVLNIVASLVLTCYPTFNLIVNIVVVAVAFLFAYLSNNESIHSAYKLALSFILPAITIIENIIGLISPSQFTNNWGIIIILCLIAFEIIILFSVKRISNRK
jgi:hypothetical protein